MLSKQTINQKKFFDIADNRYPQEKILSTRFAQQLEINHIFNLLLKTYPKNIMDFGSGSGRITIPCLERGMNVWAVDISKKSLLSLSAFYQKNRTSSWGTLNTSTSIPSKIQFDTIIGGDILHHVDIKQILPELYIALKPGGIMVFSEPNAWHLPWYLFILLFLSWDIEKGILQCNIPNLRKEFTSVGLTNFSFEGHGLIPTKLADFIPTLSRINAFILGNLPLIRYFAFRLIIYAKK